MSELKPTDLITLIYDVRSRVGAIKAHTDRLHLLSVAAKLAAAQAALIEATHEIKEESKNDPQIPIAS
jgi:hypothetical protein